METGSLLSRLLIFCLLGLISAFGVVFPALGQFDQRITPGVKRIFPDTVVPVSRYPIEHLSLASGGTRVVLANSAGQVIVYHRQSESILSLLQPHSGNLAGITLLANDREFLSAGSDNSVIISSLVTGRGVVTLSSFDDSDYATDQESEQDTQFTHINRVYGLATSQSRRFAVTGDQAGLVIVWDLVNNMPLRAFRTFERPVLALNFSPDESVIAVGGANLGIHLVRWMEQPAAEQPPYEEVPLIEDSSGVYAVEFNRDGRFLLFLDSEGGANLWQLANKTLRWRNTYPEATFVRGGFLRGDRYVIGLASRDIAVIWDQATGKEFANLYSPATANSAYVFDSLNGEFIIAGSNRRLSTYVFDN